MILNDPSFFKMILYLAQHVSLSFFFSFFFGETTCFTLYLQYVFLFLSFFEDTILTVCHFFFPLSLSNSSSLLGKKKKTPSTYHTTIDRI